MKVVILCGGLGTRLREETEFRPKPLVEIGGKPILWHIMKIFAHQGWREFILALGYKGNLIKEYFLNYEAMNSDITVRLGQPGSVKYHGRHDEQDYSVTLVDTGLASLTGARVSRVAKFVGAERFIMTYGDGVTNIDLKALVDFHVAHKRIATVTSVKVPGRFGAIDAADDGTVERFREKPATDSRISGGFFVFEPAIFDYVNPNESCVLEGEPMERLVRAGQLMAYRHEGEFYCMDTIRDHAALTEVWNSGKAPWKIW